MKKIILAGGAGFLGSSFRNFIEKKGYSCIVLTRTPSKQYEVKWDGKTVDKWKEELRGVAAVVNFTGRSVNCIHNEQNRLEIINSRILSVRVIDDAITEIKEEERPKVIVQSGSLAIYGDTTEVCDETAPHGDDFSVGACEKWEKAFFKSDLSSVRKCMLRIGFILGANGGALVPLRNLTKFFLGGTVGSGEQYISWLHVEDLNRMILRCMEDQDLSGVFNATGPSAVNNRTFMKSLRKAIGRPWSPPAPEWAVKFGARYVLRTEASLALTGRNCIPKRFLENGFEFNHTDIDKTLEEIMDQWG